MLNKSAAFSLHRTAAAGGKLGWLDSVTDLLLGCVCEDNIRGGSSASDDSGSWLYSYSSPLCTWWPCNPRQEWSHKNGESVIGWGMYCMLCLDTVDSLSVCLYPIYTPGKSVQILMFILMLGLHCCESKQSVPWVNQLLNLLLLNGVYF